jgi:hypothetical protein
VGKAEAGKIFARAVGSSWEHAVSLTWNWKEQPRFMLLPKNSQESWCGKSAQRTMA